MSEQVLSFVLVLVCPTFTLSESCRVRLSLLCDMASTDLLRF